MPGNNCRKNFANIGSTLRQFAECIFSAKIGNLFGKLQGAKGLGVGRGWWVRQTLANPLV
jgi:hypothetical protein